MARAPVRAGRLPRRRAAVPLIALLAGTCANVPATAQPPQPRIAAGYEHVVLLRADGTVWTWGRNTYGQLGDGTTTDSPTPVPVPGLSGVTDVAAGACHNLALLGDGTVRAWGSSVAGVIGNGTWSAVPVTAPVPVTGLTSVIAIACGERHNLALRSDGTVRAWGANFNGQLGQAPVNPIPSPTPIAGVTGVVSIAAGSSHSLVVRNDGSVRRSRSRPRDIRSTGWPRFRESSRPSRSRFPRRRCPPLPA